MVHCLLEPVANSPRFKNDGLVLVITIVLTARSSGKFVMLTIFRDEVGSMQQVHFKACLAIFVFR